VLLLRPIKGPVAQKVRLMQWLRWLWFVPRDPTFLRLADPEPVRALPYFSCAWLLAGSASAWVCPFFSLFLFSHAFPGPRRFLFSFFLSLLRARLLYGVPSLFMMCRIPPSSCPSLSLPPSSDPSSLYHPSYRLTPSHHATTVFPPLLSRFPLLDFC